MKSILIIFSFCFFAPLQIDGEGGSSSRLIEKAIEEHGDHVTRVLEIARNGGKINGLLKPLENELLGFGGGGFVFRGLIRSGMRLKDKRQVAIKFMTEKNEANAKREYEMYSYLYAINRPQVEKYGIPTVYYYGKWNNLTVTAYTELGETLEERKKMTDFQSFDYLFLIRHFIRQSKYMHSKGIRHDDIKPENILLKDCETFLNDFDHASKMRQDNGGRTTKFATLRHHQRKRRVPMDDWESFLYTLCFLRRLPLDWFRKDIISATKHDKDATFQLYGELKSNRTKIMEVIDQYLVNDNVDLQIIFSTFAGEVFSGKRIPDYDEFYTMVTNLLANNYAEKTCFSWIREPEQKKTKESIKKANTEISNLVIPADLNGYKLFNYPIVDEEFFNKKSHGIFGCI